MAYFRFTINPNDEQSLKRIINYPRRGIGNTTMAAIVAYAGENNVAMWDVVQNFSKIRPGRGASKVDDFSLIIKSFQQEVQRKDAYEAAHFIAKTSGLLRELHADKSVEGLARYENLQELLNAIKEFVDEADREDKSLAAFIQDIALMTDADNEGDDDNDKVSMMTIHASKGLEFKCVYVVGLEEDLFPSQMSLGSKDDLEEERRLFYVAITRAEKKLNFSYARSRYRFGTMYNSDPSRFIEEVDRKFISFNQKAKTQDDFKTPPLRKKGIVRTSIKPQKAHELSANFKASDTSSIQVGQKVEHRKFGFGTVLDVDLKGGDRKVIVNFENAGEKTLLLSFAKLMIHD